MDLTVVFDLVVDIINIFKNFFDSLGLTLFNKSISFVDILCILLLAQFILYIMHGDDE